MSDIGSGCKGSLHRGFAGGRSVRFLATSIAQIAELARQQHQLSDTSARLCAEAMVATMLMSAWVRGQERITVQIQGERPRLAFVADADSDAGIRARFSPGRIRGQTDRLHGYLHAIRADVKKEIYRGISALDGRSLEEALGAHLRDSEQVDGMLRIGVKQDTDGRITFAGGLLVERLPEHAELPWVTPEAFTHRFGSVRETPVDDLLVALAFGKLAGEDIELLENRVATWRCDCSMERIEAMLRSLGVGELTSMKDEDGQAEVTCHFCNVAYVVSGERLGELIGEVEASRASAD
jgi:molecular chaperone Hsp33